MATDLQIPLPTPVVALDPGLDLSPSQWEVLLSLCDAVIPEIRPRGLSHGGHSHGGHHADKALCLERDEFNTLTGQLRRVADPSKSEQVVVDFLAETPSKNPDFCEMMRILLFRSLSSDSRARLVRVLSVLSTSMGSMILASSVTPVHRLPLAAREKILQSWATSSLGTFRMLKASLTLLTKQVWARTSPTLEKLVGVPRIPVECPTAVGGYEYSFLQFPPGEKDQVIEADVVIVGSGCGGAVAAKNLAEAGLRVVVVDKGYHWTTEYYPTGLDTGTSHLFANGGSIISEDASTCVVAASAWGGGGTVNWSASLEPQGYVRREWASEGLPLFTSLGFQESLDRVCDAMGVSTDNLEHNLANRNILQGSRKLGWAHKAVPQNTKGLKHTCGALCTMGCRQSAKQGPAVAFLPKAAEAGATLMEGFDVHKVILEKRGSRTVAVGVKGTWRSRDVHGGVADASTVTSRRVVIKAGKVIVSGGSMYTPLLLLRSGLKNKHIGKNLHLHPVNFVGGMFDEPVVPWEGPILSSVCSEFENLDGKGHGVKLETTCMSTFAWMSWLVWNGGLEYKKLAGSTRHMSGYISVCRDRDTGSVFPDPVDGRCRVQYHPSLFDKNHIREGLVGLARINYVQGAREIFTTIPGAPHWVRDDELDRQALDASFDEYTNRIRDFVYPVETLFVSAHQMGSCRMSSSPNTGVVDQFGRVWDVDGLHVMDASVFPSASGVNPFVTTMAISDSLSRAMADKWDQKGKL
ncbi:GMC oxidoreductase [Geosmithia morbida]|uniref:Long-chain-alcohol oxidase n=1 Tax=Geosmithia morbida TaxID=1094350 RepID=A0A9P5D2H3_9HYPO|nr:GMC oxidoreductase [Geosmithia morbida]KAF4120815.1 GMC oxidoreductase [Geosmithia morbida]